MASPVVLILRPSAPGDLTQLRPVGATNNWDCVNDVVHDGDTTYVINPDYSSTRQDLYRHSGERRSGTINYVRVYVTNHRHYYWSIWGDNSNVGADPLIKTRGSIYKKWGPWTYKWDFITGYGEWTTNPATGAPWTWDDIAALQFGCELKNLGRDYGQWVPCCTQVYAQVEYVPDAGAIENIRYWNPAIGSYVSTMPTNVPLGSLIGCVASMRNTGAANQRMYMKFKLKRPDGSVRSVLDLSGNQQTLSPNAIYDQGWLDYSDMAGTWTMEIELYGETA